MKMTKTMLVSATAEKCGLTRDKAKEVVNTVMAEIAATLESGDKVQLIGFGTWRVAARAERMGRHPRTGEALTIPAHRVPVFRPGKKLKERV
jgi:DNA-binding protein HU-beta